MCGVRRFPRVLPRLFDFPLNCGTAKALRVRSGPQTNRITGGGIAREGKRDRREKGTGQEGKRDVTNMTVREGMEPEGHARKRLEQAALGLGKCYSVMSLFRSLLPDRDRIDIALRRPYA